MFEIGSRIRFIYTGMSAEITEDHMDGSYTVWLFGEEEESIAFADDIVLERNFKNVRESELQKQVKKKKKIQTKGPSTEELFFSKEELKAKTIHYSKSNSTKSVPSSQQLEIKESVFIPPPIIETKGSNSGCFLAFYPTSPNNYTIYIVNDTMTSFGFEFKLYLHKKLEHGFNKVVPANTFFPIGEFLKEQFNDSPHIDFKCPKFNFEKSIKLKYKKFAGTNREVPLMGLSTHAFLLFTKLNPYQQEQSNLKKYTQSHQKEQMFLIEPVKKLYRSFDLMDVANFSPELDLHAEKLVNDTSEFSSKELYELQLEVLDNFITKVAELDIKEVFIIHGLGKGKLKTGVEDYLKYHGDIKSYKNEFHEKYGFGATRVLLKGN